MQYRHIQTARGLRAFEQIQPIATGNDASDSHLAFVRSGPLRLQLIQRRKQCNSEFTRSLRKKGVRIESNRILHQSMSRQNL